MAARDTIIEIDDSSVLPSKPASFETASDAAEEIGTRVSQGAVTIRRLADSRSPIPIDVLYPKSPGSKTDVVRAITELAHVIELLGQARLLAKSDVAKSDRLCIEAELALPSLFECRKGIGDGFANVINALHFSFVNSGGMPFSGDQISGMWRALKELRNHPFISFEQSVRYVGELEATGLKVDPPIFGYLLDDDASDDLDDEQRDEEE